MDYVCSCRLGYSGPLCLAWPRDHACLASPASMAAPVTCSRSTVLGPLSPGWGQVRTPGVRGWSGLPQPPTARRRPRPRGRGQSWTGLGCGGRRPRNRLESPLWGPHATAAWAISFPTRGHPRRSLCERLPALQCRMRCHRAGSEGAAVWVQLPGGPGPAVHRQWSLSP